MKRHILILTYLMCIAAFLPAQNARQTYTMQYAQIAVDEMHVTGIPASITLAQGILESGNGKSQLASMSNNHFGIKCHKGWNGKSVKYDDDAPKECFRKYDNPEQSFKDHSAFLSTRSRYAKLFTLNRLDYKGWAKGLKKAGYATDPAYANRLIRIIEDEALYTYDTMHSADVGNYIAAKQRSYGQEPIITASTGQSKKPAKQPNREVTKPARIPTTTSEIDMGPASSPELPVAEEKSRAAFYQNNSKVVWAQPGDSPGSLAKYYSVSVKRLNKYNEWPDYIKGFEAGMKVYLQPKRNKSQNVKMVFHKVLPGESMYKISQSYGIKMKSLLKLNRMNTGQQPAVGELIYLRKKRKTTPNLQQPGTVSNALHNVEQPQKTVVETPVIEKTLPPVTVDATPIVEEHTPKLITSDTREKIDAQPANTITANEEQSGRAIIYDPTPEVNKRPAPTYIPPNNNGGTTHPPVISNGGAVSRTDGNNTSSIKHKVVRGDTLFGLASKYDVSVAQIKQWNSLSSNTIKLGQTLIIKK